MCPRVQVAVHQEFGGDHDHRYRVLSHHLLLIEVGTIEAGNMRAVAGDLVCFRSAEVNEYFSPEGTRTFQMQLEFAPPPHDRLTPWFDGIGPLPVKVTLGDSFGDARRVFEVICASLPHAAPAHQLRVQAAVLELLAIVSGVVDPAPNAQRRMDRWQRARLRLETNLRGDISIRQLAHAEGLGVDRFIRDFKQRFGMTPKACRTRARLEEAARLIQQDAHRPIKSVAYAVGFTDAKFFARHFRKHLSARPSDLRRMSAAAPPRPATGRRLYPMNQYILPAGTGTDWVNRLAAPRRRAGR